HFTGTWFDQADGKGPQINPTLDIAGDSDPGWLLWPGSWGDTKPGVLPLDSSSPISPGRRNHWLDPSRLARARPEAAPAPPPPPPRAPPQVDAHRDASGKNIVVKFEAEPDANALVVALRPKGSDAPATTHAFPIDASKGEVTVPAGEEDYDVWTSVATPDRG